MYLIRPNGSLYKYSQLNYVVMNLDDPDPNFSESVNYTCSIDFGSLEGGLWHYYITTKDKTSGTEVLYPYNGYEIGPEISENLPYLMCPRVTSSEYDYYKSDGWINDDFEFFVYWMDYGAELAPNSMKMCLIPAEISIGQDGNTKTSGITKFTMSSVDALPNYSNYVEFTCEVDFQSLGYNDSSIGSFHYYFEAETSDSRLVYYYNGNYSDFIGPEVRSVSETSMTVEFQSTGNLGPEVLFSEDKGRFIVNYFAPDQVQPNEVLICFTDVYTAEQISFELTLYGKSPDNREFNYYVDFSGHDLDGKGVYNYYIRVDRPNEPMEYIFFEDIVIKKGEEEYPAKSIRVVGSLSEAIATTFFIVGVYGYIPLGVLTGLGAVENYGGHWGTIAKALSIAALIGFATLNIITLVSAISSGSIGNILGVMIGSLLVWSSFKLFKSPITELFKNIWLYYSIWTMVYSMMWTSFSMMGYMFKIPIDPILMNQAMIPQEFYLKLIFLSGLWIGASSLHTFFSGTTAEKCFKYYTKFMMTMAIISSCLLCLYLGFLYSS